MPSTTPLPEPDASQRLLAWIQASAAGDAQAFRNLHRATHQRLLLLALEVLGSRERAEDALQETYVKVWRHAGSFDPGLSRPMTWLMRIARHTAIDHWRARQAELALTVPLSEDLADDIADPAGTPEERCQQARARRAAERALSGLPGAERQAAGLVLLHGCTPAEAARASGLPCGKSRLPLRRALTQLRRQLRPGAARLAA